MSSNSYNNRLERFALNMFRSGRDSFDIAIEMRITEAEVCIMLDKARGEQAVDVMAERRALEFVGSAGMICDLSEDCPPLPGEAVFQVLRHAPQVGSDEHRPAFGEGGSYDC